MSSNVDLSNISQDKLGVGSWELGVGSWELGVGSWELGVGSGEWGVGSGEWGVGSGEWGEVFFSLREGMSLKATSVSLAKGDRQKSGSPRP
ncbi:hypothetical protein FF011L_51860 [Roseimaritima multifibrata]|uniref:Uncharacterized protein n=1 Tax=Roseimaritima multifibrata TaxID=1930274 RepID=A0A517MNB3_9BACT|nr:hypothetical protein FF011L_51860 [Roseimaritima multifibrata]